MPDERAEDVTAELPVRQRWACTRQQLEDALANAEVRCDDPAGPHAGWVPDLEALASSVLNQLPCLGDGVVPVSLSDLVIVLAAAHDLCADRGAFARCAEAAGLAVGVTAHGESQQMTERARP